MTIKLKLDKQTGDLFAATMMSRKHDPDTSHIAARKAQRRACRSRAQCLRMVLEQPGLTAAEIAEKCQLPRHEPSRRLPELREMGQVRNGEKRLCGVVKNWSITWYP